MVLLGLCGYATVGKDLFADHLVEQFGYIKVGWSDPLCQLALVINPELVVGATVSRWRRKTIEVKEHLDSIVGRLGWVKAKEIPAVRQFLQVLGTEGVRECLGQDAWINASMPKIKKLLRAGEHVVVTNCRFENEGAAIKKAGGWIVKVNRPGVGPVNSHKSDAGLVFGMATFDIENDGAPEDLAPKARELHLVLDDEQRIPEYGDTDAYVRRYEETVQNAFRLGIGTILQVAAPVGTDVEDWMKRHKVEGIQHVNEDSTPFIVEVDGEDAGEINYEDGVMTIDIFVAR